MIQAFGMGGHHLLRRIPFIVWNFIEQSDLQIVIRETEPKLTIHHSRYKCAMHQRFHNYSTAWLTKKFVNTTLLTLTIFKPQQ